jgi:hypothetical protein
MEKGEEANEQAFRVPPVVPWAPFWGYVATTAVIVVAQIDSEANWWLRVFVAVLAVAANVAIITAMHRRWGYGGKNEPDWQGR